MKKKKTPTDLKRSSVDNFLSGFNGLRQIHLYVKNEDYDKAKEEQREVVVKNVSLFGSVLGSLEENTDNIQSSIGTYDYLRIKKYLLGNKILIKGMRITIDGIDDVKADSEIFNSLIFSVIRNQMHGQMASYPVLVYQWYSDKQKIKNIIDVFDYQILIDLDTCIDIKVVKDIRITFFYEPINELKDMRDLCVSLIKQYHEQAHGNKNKPRKKKWKQPKKVAKKKNRSISVKTLKKKKSKKTRRTKK